MPRFAYQFIRRQRRCFLTYEYLFECLIIMSILLTDFIHYHQLIVNVIRVFFVYFVYFFFFFFLFFDLMKMISSIVYTLWNISVFFSWLKSAAYLSNQSVNLMLFNLDDSIWLELSSKNSDTSNSTLLWHDTRLWIVNESECFIDNAARC